MNFIIVLAFLSPSSSSGYAIQACITFYISIKTASRSGYSFNRLRVFLILVGVSYFLVSLLAGVIGRGVFELKSTLILLNIFIMVSVFPFNLRIKLSDYTFLLIISSIVLSQLLYALKIEPIYSWIELFYIRDDLNPRTYQDNLGIEQISWIRFGGIFGNPNQCAKALTLAFAAYCITAHSKKYLMIAGFIGFFGIVLTGSRTGLAVFSITLILLFYKSDVRSYFKICASLIFAILLGFLLSLSARLRFFDLDSLYLSFSEKYSLIGRYIDTIAREHPLELLIGSGHIERYEFDYGDLRLQAFDAEGGYMLQAFGLIGIVAMLLFYISNIAMLSGRNRIFGVNLLWLASSTIMLNARFSLLYMLLYSCVYFYQRPSQSRDYAGYSS